MTDADLLDALARNLAGRPASALTWQELLRVRTRVARLLDAEIDKRQLDDVVARGGAS